MYSSDEDLVKAVLNKYPDAVNGFIERFAPRIHTIIASIGRSFKLTIEDIQDCCQEVIIHVLNVLSKWIPDKGELSTWINRVVRNKTYDIIRSQFKQQSVVSLIDDEDENSYNLLDFLISDAHTPEEEMVNKEDRRLVREAINTLQPKYRKVLIYKYYKGWLLKEVAAALNVPEKTIHTWHRRAKQAVARYLIKLYGE